MTIITISIVGITAVMLAVELKGVKGEYGTYLAAAAGCFIFFYGIKKMEVILDAMRRIQDMVRFSAGICKDAGYGAIGNQIEIFGKLTILAVSMPIVLALLETLQRFLQ